MQRIQCPCCGFYPYKNHEEAFHNICDICFWHYDEVAHDVPDVNIGANHVSLNEARENYMKYGVCKIQHIGKGLTRAPLPEELPENNV